ncbi:MAG: hypothetical protein IJ482_05645 [Alphaproteobacteria bacterium]|nr:hypothetical protein [Alphaproteobacteria bacterium]
MSELGALSSYALAVQQTQLSLIKNNVEMQQRLVEVLFEDNRSVPVSNEIGQNVDISI